MNRRMKSIARIDYPAAFYNYFRESFQGLYILIDFFFITFAFSLLSFYGRFHVINWFVCFQHRLDKLLCGIKD